MLTKLHVENFRLFRDVDIEFGRFNLLIGPNGSGKSTVLRALRELRNPGDLLGKLPAGCPPATKVKVMVLGQAPQGTIKRLFQGSPEHGYRIWTDQPDPLDERQHLEEWVEGFISGIGYFQLDAAKMGGAVIVNPTNRLASDGSDLASFLDWIRDNDADRFSAIESDLAKATGMFDMIGFNRPTAGQKAFKLRQNDSGHFIAAGDLSEGTVLLLAVIALAHQPQPPTVVCIEEPERGIHPRLYPQVKEALLRLAFPDKFGDKRPAAQVVATTHSPYFLDQFQDHPEFVIVCERDDEKGATFRNLGTDPRAREVLENSVLGEAWFTGTLGGVPRGT